MRRELFIYWRVPLGQAAGAEAAARQMQRGLREAEPALAARLYRRSDGERATLMETYSLPATGIGSALQQRIEDAAASSLAAWCADGRHVEVFEDCS